MKFGDGFAAANQMRVAAVDLGASSIDIEVTNGRLEPVATYREVADIRLRFEGGAVVAAEASRGREYLDAMLEIDDGARRLGEVAFGLNYEIDRFTRDILFDEKIGGTMHFALGSSFKMLGGRNESGLHWDMVCDLRSGAEIQRTSSPRSSSSGAG